MNVMKFEITSRNTCKIGKGWSISNLTASVGVSGGLTLGDDSYGLNSSFGVAKVMLHFPTLNENIHFLFLVFLHYLFMKI